MSMMTTEQLYKALLKYMGPQGWPADTREDDIRCYISSKYKLE